MDKPEIVREPHTNTGCTTIIDADIVGGWSNDSDQREYLVGVAFNHGKVHVWSTPAAALQFANQLAIMAITAEVRARSISTVVVVDADVPPMERTRMFIDEVCTAAMEALQDA